MIQNLWNASWRNLTAHLGWISLAVVLAVVPACADTTVYYLSGLTTFVDDTGTTITTNEPQIYTTYPAYVKNWIWVQGNYQALIRMDVPDTFPSLTDTFTAYADSEVRNNATGLRLYGRASFLAR